MPVTVAVGAEVTVAEDGSLWGECVEVLKELPTTNVGKISRRVLRARLAEMLTE